ncbi:MAG: GDP-mannose 4,6-dehydratase [Betaproteobacteria bacterium]|nr:GDP-mannose 4,6-dehydratase [Betaproteobacteria bacterium]
MKALICGITGQDGSYLAKLLLGKGYEVIGTSRDAIGSSLFNLDRLGIKENLIVSSMAINDFRSVLRVIQKHAPDEIYNLAGQTSVGLSFEQPVEAMESIAHGTLNILESICFLGLPIRFYNAGSSECFGDTDGDSADEDKPFCPRSPYAVAKSSAHWLVQNYREAYGLFACTGILFNHESPLRPRRFVTQKIVHAAAHIANVGIGSLELGNIDIHRDWGWAPEYVEAMWLMLQQDQAADFVIATGRSCSLCYFVERTFSWFGLNWKDHVQFNNELRRPSEITYSCGNPLRALSRLGWRPHFDVDYVIDAMCSEAKKSTPNQ